MNPILAAVNNAEPVSLDTELDDATRLLSSVLMKVNDDPGVAFEDEVIKALRLLRDEKPADYQRFRHKLKNEGVIIGQLENAINQDKPSLRDDSSAADELIKLVDHQMEFFHSENKTAYATFKVDGHFETWPIDSSGFSEYLALVSYRENNRTPSEATLNNARLGLSGKAKFDGKERKVFLRVADYQDGYVIDLGDPEWHAVVVTPKGWQVVSESPVRFWRTQTMRPLPFPVTGEYSKLWDFANIPESDRLLVLAYILECFRNNTNFPILELIGEQGTAKSSTQKILRAMIDPNEVPLRSAPRNTQDLFISAGGNWLASYNNLSHISAQVQDALCTLATGGGYSTRTLYTNTDETVIDVSRPTIINGISTLATAQDMLDRVIRIELPVIDSFKTDTEMTAAFEQCKSKIFGGLMDLFSKTLAKMPLVSDMVIKDRMADFIILGEAMFNALQLKGSFSNLFKLKKQQAITYALESSPVTSALIEYMNSHPNEGYQGQIKLLLDKLEKYKSDYSERWPKSPRGLADILRRNAPALRTIGIIVKFNPKRKEDGYHISILSQKNKTGNQCTSSTGHTGKQEKTVLPVHHEHQKQVLDSSENNYTNKQVVTI